MSQDFHWGYNNTDEWHEHYDAAKGKMQSPVDIVTKDAGFTAELSPDKTPLKMEYQPETRLELKNTGHSIQAQITKQSTLSGGPLKDKYKLEQFHLHWGKSSDKGSEHLVDGKPYAAELHLVHWNSDKYKNFMEAVDKPNGLAVLGILVKAGAENKAIKPVTDNASKVKTAGSSFEASSFNPNPLLPGNTKDYWTYPGSLTTPPCCESVTWIVFKDAVEYSEGQLASFRELEEEGHGKKEKPSNIVDNFRPKQSLGDRKIRSSFKPTKA